MSLPWHSELAISLGPGKVALARRGADLIEVPAPVSEASDVGPVVARLAEALERQGWRGGVARVIVADDWARYAVVPWPEARVDAAGRLRHARYLLGDTYGEEVAGWAVALEDVPPGRPYLACALPETLRGALEDALSPARVRLASLRPQLLAAYGAWRRRLPRDDAWFVSVGQGSLAAVYLRRGAWDRVHVARLSPDWALELERLRAFARVAGGAADGRMYVEAPAELRSAPASAGIEWLEVKVAGGERGRALALLRRARA